MMEMHLLLYSILNLVVLTGSINVSPCPKLFKYENNNQLADRWSGVVTLVMPEDTSGVILQINFDKKTLQLGNWFGEVSTTDHKEYLIRNKNITLKGGETRTVRFFVKYDINSIPPKLVSISINGKVVCPKVTKENLNIHPPPATEDEDDYYPGDFSFINRSKTDNELESICGTVIKRPKRQVHFLPYQYSYFHSYPDGYISEGHNIIRNLVTSNGNEDILQARPRPLITYGEPSYEGEYPWHVAIYHATDFDLTYICGGSLLTKFFVITVAHCVTKPKSTVTFDVVNLVTYLGKYYVRQFNNVGIQERSISKITLHPEFNEHTFSNDLALLKLGKAVEFTDYVRPICLWEDSNDLALVIRKKGRVVGWGYDETGKITDELMEISMPIVSQEKCVASFPQFYGRFTSSRTYCAGFRNGSSVCNGDSGGGMVFPKQSDNSVFQLRGLVSISIALRTQFCDTSHYVVFTDISKYLDWIRNIIII
ncbi:hypothetical protein RN001_011285 [Aquatica leii]|uniref:Peptidase S1 domain-containing protein n=1 Tax=Aquatica leii TaxID=1421715 RepID=A0AAN7PVT9_9COLE|nr:hypothetical protein RN001_011285 [Aquatica leii]